MTEKRAGLSAMTLKYIAMATMLVDHMGYVLFPWILWLRCVGRIAFPIFAFQIAEGCIRTHDRRRYALRLLLFAVLTEVPFDLAFSGRPLDRPDRQPLRQPFPAGADPALDLRDWHRHFTNDCTVCDLLCPKRCLGLAL